MYARLSGLPVMIMTVLPAQLRNALSQAGINSTHYAGHSFRIGAASTAAAKEVEHSIIKMLECWESTAYTQYIRTLRDSLLVVISVIMSPDWQRCYSSPYPTLCCLGNKYVQ